MLRSRSGDPIRSKEMRLATLHDGSRDGQLVVVSRDSERAASAASVARSLRDALDAWTTVEPALAELAHDLEIDRIASKPIAREKLMAPLPRAAEWVDGSAYLNHVRLVRRARGAEPPATLESDPLVYQGGSSDMLGPFQSFELVDETWGLDFEAELAVVLGDTPRGTDRASASRHVCLLVCLNDWTYRELVPGELAKGFGFFCSKPATGFAPFAVTPDELGEAWNDGRLSGKMHVTLDGREIGSPDTRDMQFSFFDLIQHITRTRRFGAGTILGSGTISNAAPERGVTCLQELRARETIAHGAPQTAFLRHGSQVQIVFRLPDGRTPFGEIAQEVVPP
jgi:fumarylacetoacetate (FAA) hydrolase